MRLPRLAGDRIRIVIHPDLGPHLAATSIPRRLIQLDAAVLSQPGDFERILIHEVFHFVWVRLGNPTRRAWSDLLLAELVRRSRGELGWSAEWRKNKLAACVQFAGAPPDVTTHAWKRYIRESFCDTAAWCFAGLASHEEFTLSRRERPRRLDWFAKECAGILKV